MIDPLSSEAMYDKHATVIEAYRKTLKKKKKKLKSDDNVIFYKGSFKLTYEWEDGPSDTLDIKLQTLSTSVADGWIVYRYNDLMRQHLTMRTPGCDSIV